jgi:hypothetical protein
MMVLLFVQKKKSRAFLYIIRLCRWLKMFRSPEQYELGQLIDSQAASLLGEAFLPSVFPGKPSGLN